MKKRKALLLVLCAVLLVAASVMGTMAYLTSTDEVKNTFTVGNVKLRLDEAKVDAAGEAIEGADRVKENSYKLLRSSSSAPTRNTRMWRPALRRHSRRSGCSSSA